MSGAIGAAHCLHGSLTHGTKLAISFQPFLKTSRWREWFSSNSRIFLPFLFSLFAALTYAIFDPVRVFFIVNRITGRFELGWTKRRFTSESSDPIAEMDSDNGPTKPSAVEGAKTADWLESVKNLGKGMYRTLSRFIVSVGEQGLPIWSKESYQKLQRLLGLNKWDEIVLLAGAAVSMALGFGVKMLQKPRFIQPFCFYLLSRARARHR